ncbi:MAG: ATP-binding cassette domain-containing protein, partial [Pseudomonadota bacterium]
MAVLETQKLCKSFGALTVAESIDFRLEAGARHALIGPNGAGKTTFVNMLTGAIAPTSGKILLHDHEVSKTSQSARVKLGLGRTFQITTLFRNLPVLDNVALGIAERMGIAKRMWSPASSHKNIIDESRELLATLGLADDAATAAQDLP